MTAVIFECNSTTKLGESVVLVGNVDWLGDWKPVCGIQLKTSADLYPLWRSEVVNVPAEAERVEFKFVVETKDVRYIWEETLNRCLETEVGRDNVLIRYTGTFNNPTGTQTIEELPGTTEAEDGIEAQDECEREERFAESVYDGMCGDDEGGVSMKLVESNSSEEGHVTFAETQDSPMPRHIGLSAIFKSEYSVVHSETTYGREHSDGFSEGGIDRLHIDEEMTDSEYSHKERVSTASSVSVDSDVCGLDKSEDISGVGGGEYIEKSHVEDHKRSDKGNLDGVCRCTNNSSCTPACMGCVMRGITFYDNRHGIALANAGRESNSRSDSGNRDRVTERMLLESDDDMSAKSIIWYEHGGASGVPHKERRAVVDRNGVSIGGGVGNIVDDIECYSPECEFMHSDIFTSTLEYSYKECSRRSTADMRCATTPEAEIIFGDECYKGVSSKLGGTSESLCGSNTNLSTRSGVYEKSQCTRDICSSHRPKRDTVRPGNGEAYNSQNSSVLISYSVSAPSYESKPYRRVVTTPSTYSCASPSMDTSVETPRASISKAQSDENSVRDTASPAILESYEERVFESESPDQSQEINELNKSVDKVPQHKDWISDICTDTSVGGDWYRLHCIVVYLLEFIMVLLYYIYEICTDILYAMLRCRGDQPSTDSKIA